VTWPAPGQPVGSSTALFVPYRPAELTATVPCSAVRAAADRGAGVTILATGTNGDGLVLQTRAGGGRRCWIIGWWRWWRSTPRRTVGSSCRRGPTA
jgi:hypothetical protein